MTKVGVSLKIDVSKIEKARLFKGQKGTYLDATVFVDLGEADQYGNHGMITQNVSKEERESGTRGPILGNCKVFYRDGIDETPSDPRQQPTQGSGGVNGPGYDDFSDEIPFLPMHGMMGG